MELQSIVIDESYMEFQTQAQDGLEKGIESLQADIEKRQQFEKDEEERIAKEEKEAEEQRQQRETQIAEEAAAKAVQEEKDKQAEEQRKAAAAEEEQRIADEARAADKEHRKTINVAAKEALIAEGLSAVGAEKAIKAIAKGLIPNITINY